MPGLLESEIIPVPQRAREDVRSAGTLLPSEQFDQDELLRRVSREIKRETNLGVQEMQVRFENNAVIISGYCRTFYTKQLAQQAVIKMLGEIELINRIRVI